MGNRRASDAPVSIVSAVFASGFGEISSEAESGSLGFVGGASDVGCISTNRGLSRDICRASFQVRSFEVPLSLPFSDLRKRSTKQLQEARSRPSHMRHDSILRALPSAATFSDSNCRTAALSFALSALSLSSLIIS